MARSTPSTRPVAVVTGAGRGLGRSVSIRLAEQGWNLVLVARTEPELNETASSVRRSGGAAVVVAADLRDRDVPEQVMSAAVEQLGHVDGLVCNAAIYRSTPLVETSDDEWREVLDTNVGSTFRLLRAVGRHLIDNARGGSVVIVGSVFGLVGGSNTAAYAASKGALVALTRTLAIEWARHGIRVNMVAPGHIQTDMALGSAAAGDSDSFLKTIPMRRIARPEEIAAQVAHVLGPESSFMTGAVNVVTTGVVCEEVGRADFTMGYLLNNAALVTEVLMKNATADQQFRFVPPITRGDTIPALCLTEPDHGSDAAAVTMRASRVDGGWLLDGEKTSVTFGMRAPVGLVFARTSAGRSKGITAFFVDLDADGVTRSPFSDLGGRAVGRAAIHFEQVFVEDDRVIGPIDQGFTQVLQGFEFARALIALICVGAASASIDEALEYARHREAFGQPIGRFQGVAFPLVEHQTKLVAARLLALRALQLKDRGLDHRVESNMAKWWAPRVAFDAAHDALLVFGHAAYSDEYPLAQRVRDIIGMELGDGTANIAKLVVARELLGRDFAP